ncbi:MAG TPA: OsmC family protein [Victivallales bacterium]|nr:OsmC family protein [Victivallales bacterium]
MSLVKTIYDGKQHCISTKFPQGNKIGIDCPYTGKGEEFSPINLVESALGGCMLLSMGTLALRMNIDISNTRVDVKIITENNPSIRYKKINVNIYMADNYSDKDRIRLERAAANCPVRKSFDKEIIFNIKYVYP